MEARQDCEPIRSSDLLVGLACAKGRYDDAVAAPSAVPVHGGNVDEAPDEADVQHDGDEGGDCVAGKTAEERQSHERVQHGGARDALDGSDRIANAKVVVVEGGEKVREGAEDNGGTEKLDAADEPLQ